MGEGKHLTIFAGVAVGVHLRVQAKVELPSNASRLLGTRAFTAEVSARESPVAYFEFRRDATNATGLAPRVDIYGE